MKKGILIFLFASLLSAQSFHQYENQSFGREKLNEGLSFNFQQRDGVLSDKKINALNKAVFGFLPWWEYNAGNHLFIRYDLVSHIAIFSFETDGEGNLTDPPLWPWNDLINSAHSKGVKVIMAVTSFNGDDIHRIMTDNGIRRKLCENIRTKIILYNLDGVIIDFENLKDEDDKKYATISFMTVLKDIIQNQYNPDLEISFATPSYGRNERDIMEWNFPGLAEKCNYLFVMNYDYWGSWAITTGPSAPLTGQYISVTNSITEEYKNVPRNKIILGVPYYGNYWKTSSGQPYVSVFPFSSDSTNNNWQKILLYREIMDEYSTYDRMWDEVSSTPWIRWFDNGWHQVWYDDHVSLEMKYDLAIQQNLFGVGIWALGYDGDRDELWNLIEKKFVNNTAVNADEELPAEFVLSQNYPNPFNPETKINFQLSSPGNVRLTITDQLGREVIQLINEYRSPGRYTLTFSAEKLNMASGVYFYSLSLGGTYSVKKMVYMK
ncbi:MAG TPA: glycosyl hydrolase family 18 protein [Melioribacteraceae bacterium]|nr:glycosyl hydrolase family 18 protein [Melioribacteraceae bacterium]